MLRILATEELEEKRAPMGIGMQRFLGKSYFFSQRFGRWGGLYDLNWKPKHENIHKLNVP